MATTLHAANPQTGPVTRAIAAMRNDEPVPPRRGFLRGLLSLPLIGGGVTLIPFMRLPWRGSGNVVAPAGVVLLEMVVGQLYLRLAKGGWWHLADLKRKFDGLKDDAQTDKASSIMKKGNPSAQIRRPLGCVYHLIDVTIA